MQCLRGGNLWRNIGKNRNTERTAETAYDRVPRQEVWGCTREKGVPEKYVMIVQDMYEVARTRVTKGYTKDLP